MDAWTLGQVHQVWQARIAEEREACAKIAEERVFKPDSTDLISLVAKSIAAAIRARTPVVPERSEAP